MLSSTADPDKLSWAEEEEPRAELDSAVAQDLEGEAVEKLGVW